MSWSPDPLHLPLLIAGGWLVRAPLVSREEGHEAITRQAWDGLGLRADQQAALIRGVRAPDVSLSGFLISALPVGQRRHALRAWSGTTTADAVRATRAFMSEAHDRALARRDGAGRWAAFGEVLHCLQDSYSPAHAARDGGRILRMRHWGPLDRLRGADEHGFPADRRDNAWADGSLTEEALAAVAASRGYLEIALRGASRDAFGTFLDGCLQIAPLAHD